MNIQIINNDITFHILYIYLQNSIKLCDYKIINDIKISFIISCIYCIYFGIYILGRLCILLLLLLSLTYLYLISNLYLS